MRIEPPPLPEPFAFALPSEQHPTLRFFGRRDGDTPMFTADQLRERDTYWMAKLEEAVRQERERCAKLCEARNVGTEPKFPDYDGGYWSGVEDCAAAIREQK